MQYMCFYTDLWTGEKLGSSRGVLHIDDVAIHGNVALRVICRKVTDEEAQSTEELRIKYHNETTLKVSPEEVYLRE